MHRLGRAEYVDVRTRGKDARIQAPAGTVNAELADLRTEVAQLKAENARMIRLLELTPDRPARRP